LHSVVRRNMSYSQEVEFRNVILWHV
jgi:hypothetical protein